MIYWASILLIKSTQTH